MHWYPKAVMASILVIDDDAQTRAFLRRVLAVSEVCAGPGDAVLEDLEADAREARKGLWAESNPVPPWEWRGTSKLYR